MYNRRDKKPYWNEGKPYAPRKRRGQQRGRNTLTRWMPEYKFWSDYNLYLRSNEWLAKREAVMRRARYVCEVCHRREAQHVHHLTYNHVFDERLYELQAVCLPCHDRLHDGKLSHQQQGWD